jgi:hypothetical protein
MGISVLPCVCLWILVTVMWSCLLLLFMLSVLVGDYLVVGNSFFDFVALASL